MRSDEIPTVSEVQLEVPDLGTIDGLNLNDEVCQYLGIPYATVPGRFRRSVPAEVPWPDRKWDGTKLGPFCPQPPRDFYPVPSPERPWLDTPPTDEFNCLNLNISVPRVPSQSTSLLPVMVFIHGGAFTYSTGSSPVYDGRLLAAASSQQDLSLPTIVVTFNYRLGVYGFLAGRDIESYNASHGEQGVGNYAIWDQVLALRWIQRHIAAFGGDPARVTLFGQSAGGVSVHAHLLRGEPLFSSAVLQSGLVRLCGVMSVDEWQVAYERMLGALGIPLDLPASERVQRLLEVDTESMTTAMVPAFIIPVITMSLCDDGVMVPGPLPKHADYASFQVPDWCPRLIIGDCQNECIIWNKSWDILSPVPMPEGADLATPSAQLVLAKMESYLGIPRARAIAELYGLNDQSTPAETFEIVERLTSDGMYRLLIHFAQRAAASSVYAYHFDCPSPFDNAWGGYAHHSHDNVLIWGVLKHLLPESQREVSDKMAEAWIRFANGEEPWERLSERQRWMIFSEEGASLKSKDEDGDRGYETWEKLHDAGLVTDLSNLSDELCLRRSELLST